MLNNNYIKDFGKQDSPIEFMEWIIKNNYTLEVYYELFREKENYIEFHGNVLEESCPFKYDIHDDKIVKNLKKLIIDNGVECVFAQL